MLLHGHYHVRYTAARELSGGGRTAIIGLGDDGGLLRNNFVSLDVRADPSSWVVSIPEPCPPNNSSPPRSTVFWNWREPGDPPSVGPESSRNPLQSVGSGTESATMLTVQGGTDKRPTHGPP